MEEPQGGFSADSGMSGLDEPSNNDTSNNKSDKPFDDEPFDAGVGASEEDDPKKFIQQLSGKLGQSLRKYTDEQGQPDLELEKFAINSVISATHTSHMDQEDKNDIISKIENSGKKDDENRGMEKDLGSEDNLGDEDELEGGEFGGDNLGGEEEIFGESLKMSKNIYIFDGKNIKSMIKTSLKETFDCGCNIDEVIDGVMTQEPIVKPAEPKVIPETKPTPSRRSKPYKVPTILPETAPMPKFSK